MSNNISILDSGQKTPLLLREAASISRLFSRELFTRLLMLEHKRAERTGRPFVVMLLQSTSPVAGRREKTLETLAAILSRSTRKTDVKGWYDSGSTIGVIFTEIGLAVGDSTLTKMLDKLTHTIQGSLAFEDSSQVKLSYSIYPEIPSSSPLLTATEDHTEPVGKA